MNPIDQLDHIAITVKSHRLLKTLLKENPKLEGIMRNSKNEIEARIGLREWVLDELRQRPQALAYYESRASGRDAFEADSFLDPDAQEFTMFVSTWNDGEAFEGAVVSFDGPRIATYYVTKRSDEEPKLLVAFNEEGEGVFSCE